MEVKLNLTKDEHKELVSYCNLNDLLISSVVKDSFTTGFNIERYGLLNSNLNKEKVVEKEVIREKRVEIPVEVIKEVVKIEYVEVEKPVEKIVERVIEKPVQIIKEVPVEKVVEKIVEITKEVPVEKVIIKEVIKEVPVEKVVEKIIKVSDDTQEMENIFQEEMSKKDKELDELRHSLDILRQTPPLEKVVVQEKIVEIEKPIEIIKEIVIEKEGDSKSKLEALQNTVQKLKLDNIEKDKKIKEYEKTIQDIQKFQEDKKAMFLRGSNLDDNLYK